MKSKETNYKSPAVIVVDVVAVQVLCSSGEPGTSNLGSLIMGVDKENSLVEDDWE